MQQGKSGAAPKKNEGTKMQCKCGAEIESTSRMIKTKHKAQEWSERQDIEVPVILTHLVCNGCGREGRIIFSMDGKEIIRKNM